MSKSNASSIPGVGAMTDTLEFVKNMWGGMKIPNMVIPTLSVDDINKQIADLKAVESWLTLNMNMLRGTIQALEVQSATISTLKSMGESMTAMVKPNGASSASSSSAPPFGMGMPGAPGNSPDSASAGKPAGGAGPAPEFSFAAPTAEKPPAPKTGPESEAEPGSQSPAQQASAGALGLAAAPFANPAAWWNMLQEQFKHAVNTAVMQEPEPEPEPAAEQPKAKASKNGSAAAKAAAPKAKKNGSASSKAAAGKSSSGGKRKPASKS